MYANLNKMITEKTLQDFDAMKSYTKVTMVFTFSQGNYTEYHIFKLIKYYQ